MKRKPFSRINLVIILFSVICGLALVEVIAVNFPQNLSPEIHSKKYSTYRPEIGIVTNQANSTQIISNPWIYNTVSYNDYGFRGSNWPCNKPIGELRIAILGDSYIEGREVLFDELITTVLQQLLGQGNLVMNFGLSGAGQAEQILLYKNFVRQFKPDIVIHCMTPSNDFEDNVRELSGLSNKNFLYLRDGELITIPLPAWVIFLLSPPVNRITNYFSNLTLFKLVNSTLMKHYSSRLSYITPRKAWANHEDPTLPRMRAFGSEKYDYARKIMGKALVSLQKISTEDNARFILASTSGCWTFIAQEEPAFSKKSDYLASRYQWVEQFVQEHAIAYINLNKAFLEAYKSRKLEAAALHIPWDGHWTAMGHHLAAESIFSFLRDRGYLAEIRQSK